MSAARVLVDLSMCASTGMCEARAPEVFEIDDDGALRVLQDPVAVEQQQAAREAAAGCPTRALRLVEATP